MENNITKQEYKKALEDGKIYIVGCKYTRNGWVSFRICQLKKGALQQVIVKGGYWNEKLFYYKCNIRGTDRNLKIILAIGYKLGLSFNEMRQNTTFLSHS